ncbi:MAG: hypothetical protein ACYS8K_11015, partial [Planctomycetota bacterium]
MNEQLPAAAQSKARAAPPDLSPRAFWLGLGALVVFGLVTRLLFLGQVYVWIDETPILAPPLWSRAGAGLAGLFRAGRDLCFDVYRQQTDNGTWAGLVFLVCRTVGRPTIFWARLPSALAGVALLPALALLTRQATGSHVAGLAAAGAAATSVAQIHYAQQVLPYGPAVLAAALVVWAALSWHRSLAGEAGGTRYLPAGWAFFAAAAAAALLHNCLLPVVLLCCGAVGTSILW